MSHGPKALLYWHDKKTSEMGTSGCDDRSIGPTVTQQV